MKILERFRKKTKKEEEKKEEKAETAKKPSALKLFCGEDKEVYQALSQTLLLNLPSKTSQKVSAKEILEETLKEASKREGAGDSFQAGLRYYAAGQLSLFAGDLEGVKSYFGKAQELTGRRYSILEIPEKAVEMARKYYQSQQSS